MQWSICTRHNIAPTHLLPQNVTKQLEIYISELNMGRGDIQFELISFFIVIIRI